MHHLVSLCWYKNCHYQNTVFCIYKKYEIYCHWWNRCLPCICTIRLQYVDIKTLSVGSLSVFFTCKKHKIFCHWWNIYYMCLPCIYITSFQCVDIKTLRVGSLSVFCTYQKSIKFIVINQILTVCAFHMGIARFQCNPVDIKLFDVKTLSGGSLSVFCTHKKV